MISDYEIFTNFEIINETENTRRVKKYKKRIDVFEKYDDEDFIKQKNN